MTLNILQKTLFTLLCILFTLVILGGGYLWYDSQRALNFMTGGVEWEWVEYQPLHHGLQQARTPHSHQLVYRQVNLDQQSAAFVNTTNNNHMLFTFIKREPCKVSDTYNAQLSVNHATAAAVTFHCEDNQRLIFRVAQPRLISLSLNSDDISFELDHQAWRLNVLRKDDFMQRNSEFFQKHSDETVYPWSRD